MIVEIIRYAITTGREADFEEAYTKAQPHLMASPHCLGFRMVRCVKVPSRFVLLIEWDSADGHMNGFRKSANFPPFYALVAPFFGQIEEMEHYETTPVAWSRADGIPML